MLELEVRTSSHRVKKDTFLQLEGGRMDLCPADWDRCLGGRTDGAASRAREEEEWATHTGLSSERHKCSTQTRNVVLTLRLKAAAAVESQAARRCLQ